MNEKLKEFIAGIGAMTELWTITYNSFRDHGLGHVDSLEHTGAFMKSILTAFREDTNSNG
jgi:hypothetical protein